MRTAEREKFQSLRKMEETTDRVEFTQGGAYDFRSNTGAQGPDKGTGQKMGDPFGEDLGHHTTLPGERELNAWRERNPGRLLDCAGINLSGKLLHDRNLSSIDFTGADFRDAQLPNASLARSKLDNALFDRARLRNVNLTEAILTRASFRNADLTDASLVDATFDETRFDQASLGMASFGEGADFHGSSFPGCNFDSCTLVRASFRGCDLVKAKLRSADCMGAQFDGANLFEAKLEHANLAYASLQHANLKGADLTSANLAAANLRDASVHEAKVDAANFLSATGLHRCRDLSTVRIESPAHPRYVETVVVPAIDRLLGWDRLRVLGKLPLFGASYSALGFLIFFFYLLRFYNQKLDQIRSIAEATDAGGVKSSLANAILRFLHHEPPPTMSVLLFLSTISLAIAATVYAVKCDERVQEFSKAQWRDQLERSLIHYLPFCWEGRAARIICAVTYLLGGLGALSVLAVKIVETLMYLTRD